MQTTSAHGIDMQQVESSQIEAIGHDDLLDTLAIQFKAKPGSTAPGSIYHYRNVDLAKFIEFRRAESIGSYFYKNIKPFPEKFPYQKMS